MMEKQSRSVLLTEPMMIGKARGIRKYRPHVQQKEMVL